MALDAKFFEQWETIQTIATEQKLSPEAVVSIQKSFFTQQEKAQAQLDEDKAKIDKILDDPNSKDLTVKDVIAKAEARFSVTTRAYVSNSRSARKKLLTDGK